MRVTDTSNAPMYGITVLEVGAFIAAPYATLQLADLGARVIKVENPAGGDTVRSIAPLLQGEGSAFMRLNRNKESVAIDLKSPQGSQVFRRLANRADVVVENLRPGGMSGLGLGYDDLRDVNPRLIYASVSGWGQDGPLSRHAGLDIMAQARSGLMSVDGSLETEPIKASVPICDLVCALYVALAVVAAVRARDESGEGQYIDVSLFESGVSLAVWEAAGYFATGEVKPHHGSAHQSLAPYQALRTVDGFLTAGAVTPKTWAAFCAVLQLPHLEADPRYIDASSRFAHRDSLIPMIELASSTWTKSDLAKAMEDAGVPCSPVCSFGDVFTDEHLIARDFFWDAPHPTQGSVRQLGSPMRLSRTPVRRSHAGPRLGADTEAVLSSLGISDGEIDDLLESGVAAQAPGWHK